MQLIKELRWKWVMEVVETLLQHPEPTWKVPLLTHGSSRNANCSFIVRSLVVSTACSCRLRVVCRGIFLYILMLTTSCGTFCAMVCWGSAEAYRSSCSKMLGKLKLIEHSILFYRWTRWRWFLICWNLINSRIYFNFSTTLKSTLSKYSIQQAAK